MHSILQLMRLRLFGLSDEDDIFYSIDQEQVQSYQGMIEGSNGFYRLHLQVLGYQPWLLPNIAPFLFLCALFTTIGITIAIITLIRSPKGTRKERILRLLPFFANFLTRFTYFAFFELSLCALLSLSLALTSTEISEPAEIVLSGIFLIAMCTFLAQLIFTWRQVPMHSAKTFESVAEKKQRMRHYLCCWEKRPIKSGLV